MQCKSLWIKASAKCINVNVNVIPALYAAVRWLTASRIVLSTHGFWFEKVFIVTVSVACSVSVFTKLNATSVNSLTSDELARNMSQSTSSRDACSVASEWGTSASLPSPPGVLEGSVVYNPVWGRWRHGLIFQTPAVSGLCRHFWIGCSNDRVYSVLWGQDMCWWKLGMTFLRLALLKSPATIHAASGCMLIYPLSSSCSLDKAKLLSACGGIYTAVTTVDENSRGR